MAFDVLSFYNLALARDLHLGKSKKTSTGISKVTHAEAGGLGRKIV